MAKKKAKKTSNSVLDSAKFAGNLIKNYIEHFSRVFVENIYLAEKKMVLAIGSHLMLALSAIIIIISFIFILEEFFGISRSISFLVLGIVIMIWSLLLKGEADKIKLKGA